MHLKSQCNWILAIVIVMLEFRSEDMMIPED